MKSFAFAICMLAGASAAIGQSVEWIRQFGSAVGDSPLGTSADGLGSIYVSGITRDNPIGGVVADGFLTKFDTSGAKLWNLPFGPTGLDSGTGVSADKLGNVFVVGQTTGSIGGSSIGAYDANLNKYDSTGNLVWARQYGTTQLDESRVLAADGLGNVYIAGNTGGNLFGTSSGQDDSFLAKIDSLGNLLWTRQFGTSGIEQTNGFSIDGLGNVYISGTTSGSLGAPNAGFWDAYVRKYDASGNELWTRQVGTTEYENTTRVAADPLGNVYVSGTTTKSLGGPEVGFQDAYLLKYDSSGSLLWSKQFGTPHQTFGNDVFADGLGVYTTGTTDGSLADTNAGGFDFYVRRYDNAGNLLWTRQLGTSGNEDVVGLTTDHAGVVYVTGTTRQLLPGASAGDPYGYLAKFSDNVPEPMAAVLIGIAVISILFTRHTVAPCRSLFACAR